MEQSNIKITKKQFKLVIENFFLNEYDMGWGDYVPGEDDESVADLRQKAVDKFVKNIEDFLLGVPVDEIFNSAISKKEVAKILKDKASSLKFDGLHIHWLSSSGKPYISLPAGSGYEMFKNNQFLSPASKIDPRSKMHEKNVGPAPEGEYIVYGPESAGSNLRDANSLLGECGFWLGAALKALGRGKQYTTDWQNVKWSPMVKATWGNYRCKTKMISGDNPSNRSGIFVHGGVDQSSAGCIDLASSSVDNMNIFGPLYVLWYASHGNIKLKADYNIHYK
tara:strand:+ start:2573 stop:3409 length:837 start_codon:yes stop_codon:yes gene_type:complete